MTMATLPTPSKFHIVSNIMWLFMIMIMLMTMIVTVTLIVTMILIVTMTMLRLIIIPMPMTTVITSTVHYWENTWNHRPCWLISFSIRRFNISLRIACHSHVYSIVSLYWRTLQFLWIHITLNVIFILSSDWPKMILFNIFIVNCYVLFTHFIRGNINWFLV